MNNSRRKFLQRSSIVGAGLGASMLANKSIAHAQQQDVPPKTGNRSMASQGANVAVETPDLPKLPYTMDGNVKVFQLTAEVMKREFMPASEMSRAKVVDVWGYNGSMPGPTVEVNEGDTVRFIFRNNLPEASTIHWHGLEVPLEMDGVPYISQPPVEPGGTFVYEFTLHQNGTFFYHSHFPMQELMGLFGLFIIHPKTPHQPRVDKDFGIILQEWAILPNSTIPNTLAMEFNWLTMNGKAGPNCTPMIVRQGERVRIRIANIGMTHHPIHIHGNQFYVTGTEGGRVPESAWYPGNTALVGVAQARDVEFDAIYPGEWMLHCHLPHHMMNQMISMAGLSLSARRGVQSGAGMEEGMGIVRQGNALDSDLGPSFGRGMGQDARERNTSPLVGQDQNAQQSGTQQMKGMQEMPGMKMQGDDSRKKRVPGYPQDMIMIMDAAVAKPHTYGLPPGWTASMMGMMTLVRVLPPDMYDEVMQRIRDGRVEPPSKMPNMPGHNMPGMNMPGMNMPEQKPKKP